MHIVSATVPARASWWRSSPVPVLDMQAQDDPWRPAASRMDVVAALGKKASVVVVPRASHALFPEQPAAVAAAIVGWIAGLPP